MTGDRETWVRFLISFISLIFYGDFFSARAHTSHVELRAPQSGTGHPTHVPFTFSPHARTTFSPHFFFFPFLSFLPPFPFLPFLPRVAAYRSQKPRHILCTSVAAREPTSKRSRSSCSLSCRSRSASSRAFFSAASLSYRSV